LELVRVNLKRSTLSGSFVVTRYFYYYQLELTKARLETQRVRLELEGAQFEADLQHDRTRARLSSGKISGLYAFFFDLPAFYIALAKKDKEIESLRAQFDDKVSQLELNLDTGERFRYRF
jgi:hypothetical protein